MTGKEFYKKITNGKGDVVQAFVDILAKNKIKFCVIGGLGVNAYAEPVVSLDLDLVIVSERVDFLLTKLKGKFKVEQFTNSINISGKKSDLRIQIQTDPRYQPFLDRAKVKNVLGYKLPVSVIEDVFQGKVWAAMDETRRPSKRQKDLADILRLVEAKAELKDMLPWEVKGRLGLG